MGRPGDRVIAYAAFRVSPRPAGFTWARPFPRRGVHRCAVLVVARLRAMGRKRVRPKAVQLGAAACCQGSGSSRICRLIVALRPGPWRRPLAVWAAYLEIARLTTRG